jgi:predicted transcriptional regulator
LTLGDRLKTEVLYDVLVNIHLIRRAGKAPSLSRIAHRANVSDARLKDRLGELAELGFVDSELSITPWGYEFIGDYQKHITPIFRKYGLRGRGAGKSSY